jgi:hypothetical protein
MNRSHPPVVDYAPAPKPELEPERLVKFIITLYRIISPLAFVAAFCVIRQPSEVRNAVKVINIAMLAIGIAMLLVSRTARRSHFFLTAVTLSAGGIGVSGVVLPRT